MVLDQPVSRYGAGFHIHYSVDLENGNHALTISPYVWYGYDYLNPIYVHYLSITGRFTRPWIPPSMFCDSEIFGGGQGSR